MPASNCRCCQGKAVHEKGRDQANKIMKVAKLYGGQIQETVWILIKELFETSDETRMSAVVATESPCFLGLSEHDSVTLFRLFFDLEFLLFSLRQQPNLKHNLLIVLQIPPDLFPKVSVPIHVLAESSPIKHYY